MFSNNRNGSCAAFAGGNVLGLVLAMGLGLMAQPAAAAPFAYVVNNNSNTVSVIDTATNNVVATIPVGNATNSVSVAVAPDGKHAYGTNFNSNTVSVIDTATNTVEAATLTVGRGPEGIAVTPDGKHAYVTNDTNRPRT